MIDGSKMYINNVWLADFEQIQEIYCLLSAGLS